MQYELAIIIPTFNEAKNIPILLNLLENNLVGILWECIVVDDDSPDKTAEIVFNISKIKNNIRCIKRINRRGLSSAVIDGMMSTNANYIAVMDADLQHDESLIKIMLDDLKINDLDIIVASRFLEESKLEEFDSAREKLSKLANFTARKLFKIEIKDPLSGFFIVTRSFINEVIYSISGQGFKILLDIFASSKQTIKYKEIPFTFKKRRHGESKLDTLVSLEFVMLIASKIFGQHIPVRYVIFVLVGLFGVMIHLISLGFFFKYLDLSFMPAQILATYFAMSTNFYMNNLFTYRDKRLYGKSFLVGLLTFFTACSIGGLINFIIAYNLYEEGVNWLIAGILGGVVSSVWNYSVTSSITWKIYKS